MAAKRGRNDPCPSGQPIKFKKCLANHPQLHADALPAAVWWVCSRWIGPRPPAWELLDSLPETVPVPAKKVTAMLDELLHDAPEDIAWADLLMRLRNGRYPDLAGVFRRIDRELPADTKERDKAYFYWGASEALDNPDLLREVAAGFMRLDGDSYDADALLHVEDRLLSEGLEEETLQLAQRFLPIMEADDSLLPHAVPELTHRILYLRLGRLMRQPSGGMIDPERIMRDALAGLPDHFGRGPLRKGVEILFGLAPESKVKPEDLSLVLPARKKISEKERFRTWNTLLRAVREAFLIDGGAPGQALCTMYLLLEAADDDLERKGREGVEPVRNLADLPGYEDLDGFLARASRQFVSIDRSKAKLLLIAVRILTRFLARHEVVDAAMAQTAEIELDRLTGLLNQSDEADDDLSPGNGR